MNGTMGKVVTAGLLALAVAGCATTDDAVAASSDAAVSQQSVAIAVPDGAADALLFTPAGGGKWPAVIVWADLGGLRPALGDIGRRLAREGYVVLVPNAYYRSAKLDGVTEPGPLTPEDRRARMTTWRAAANDENIIADARAYMAYLDALPQVDTGRKAGSIGYDYGAAFSFDAARAMPERFGAVAALQPFGIATTRPTSPHLFVDQSSASYFVAIAQPDDEREPGDKDDLRKAFADARLPATVEVYPAGHGFVLPDSPSYDPGSADAAWMQVLALLSSALR